MEKIIANWPAPSNITAFTTTINGGVSEGAFATNNMGKVSGENLDHVAANRAALNSELGADKMLMWLSQVHGDTIVFDKDYQVGGMSADASISRNTNAACAIMTADCLPVLICNKAGNQVAALHCGWKGLYLNLIAKTLQHFDKDVLVWLGPAISQANYEVDSAFYQRFVELNPDYKSAFIANRAGHYLCDLYAIARLQLQAQGVTAIYGGEYCTFADPRFYSYRQNPNTGRQVSVITFDN